MVNHPRRSKWLADTPGWERKDHGSVWSEYRHLLTGPEREQFHIRGTSPRYHLITVTSDGAIITRSAAGYSHTHCTTVDEAKAWLLRS